MSKKKVAFLIFDMVHGGAERVLSTLANYFTNTYDVSLITIVKADSFYQLNDEIKMFNCRENEVENSNIISSLKTNYSVYKQLKQILKNEQIDLLINFMTASNVLGCLAARSQNIPCILSERSNPYRQGPNFIWSKLVKYSYPKANYLVVQSQLVKDYYKSMMDAKKIVILPNPLSNELINLKDLPSEKDNVILNVGRLVNGKSQDLLIRAFSNINNKNWKLVFVGDGPLLSEFKDLSIELNQSKNITFTGKINAVAPYYNSSKIFAFTSEYEGFPNALIEAMYFELACISTDCPSGPSELIDHNNNGYLINIGDQDELEKQLIKLMNDSSLCATIGKKGFETASNYRANSVAEKWRVLIEQLLNN